MPLRLQRCAAVRRDSEQGYEEFLMELASGIETPRREDLAKLDRKRTGKGSNRVWKHPHDADARITRMKDGRTHLAHKAEHAVDLETGAIVSVTVQGGSRGHADHGLTEAAEKVEQALEASKRWWPTRGARSGWWTWMRWDCAAM